MTLVVIDTGECHSTLQWKPVGISPICNACAGSSAMPASCRFGEATHGTREFFQLATGYLSSSSPNPAAIFGIEANYPECLRVNDYVLHGKGDPAGGPGPHALLDLGYEEVLALDRVVRSWNKAQARKVKFYGFDMQFSTEAALDVVGYLKRVAPDLAAVAEDHLWPLCDDFSADRFHALPEAVRDTTCACIKRILNAFAREHERWSAMTGELNWRLARLNAVVLDQNARYRLSQLSRDVAMAENVAALLELEGSDSKAGGQAHNGHAVRQSPYVMGDKTIPNMGSHLDGLLGRRHRVVGFAFNQGSFQAIEQNKGLHDFTVGPAPTGSLDVMLAETGICRAPPAAPTSGLWRTGSQRSRRPVGLAQCTRKRERKSTCIRPTRAGRWTSWLSWR